MILRLAERLEVRRGCASATCLLVAVLWRRGFPIRASLDPALEAARKATDVSSRGKPFLAFALDW
jgi:hypothetical protein